MAVVIGITTSTAPFVWSHEALALLARATGIATVRPRLLPYRMPLAQLVGELRNPPRGPVAAAVEYLDAHAQPGDVIVATYGELPLKFHTSLSVYGGETAQLPPDGVKARWLWPRHLTLYREVRPAAAWIENEIASGAYTRFELPVADRRWENREDPEQHIFGNPGPDGPRIVMYRRSD
jgi:hypothetical protein